MKASFHLNQIVWAKLSGYPWWPAYIKQILTSGIFEVEYFGQFNRNFLDPSHIQTFDYFPQPFFKNNNRLKKSFEQANRVLRGKSTILSELRSLVKKRKNNNKRISIFNKNALINECLTTYLTRKISNSYEITGDKNQMYNSRPNLSKLSSENSNTKQKLSKFNQKENQIKPKQNPLFFNAENTNSEVSSVAKINADFPKNYTNHQHQNPFNKLNNQEDIKIKILENNLWKIYLKICQKIVPIPKLIKKLRFWFEELIHLNPKAEKLYLTKIGVFIFKINEQTNNFSLQQIYVNELKILNQQIINKLESGILNGFFQNQQNIILTIESVFLNSKKNAIKAQKIKKKRLPDNFPQTSNLYIFESKTSQIFEKKLVQIDQKSKQEFLPESTVFKVSKKIAKLLYQNKTIFRATKIECENIANLIENRIRSCCKGSGEYQQKCVLLFNKLTKKYESFFLNSNKSIPFNEILPISDIIQSFLIKR